LCSKYGEDMWVATQGGLSMAQGLVCGMQVDEQQAKAKGLTSEYQGQTYYFCAKGCKTEFDTHPEQYVRSQ
jgi:YHS domain-containing protein